MFLLFLGVEYNIITIYGFKIAQLIHEYNILKSAHAHLKGENKF
jgi:hypothetical protein